MDATLRTVVLDDPSYIFIGDLLQFCLSQSRMIWFPIRRNYVIVNTNRMLIVRTVGNEVMNTLFRFPPLALHGYNLFNRIVSLQNPLNFQDLRRTISEYASYFYRYANPVTNTYLFLAIIVIVSMKCHFYRRPHIIQYIVSIVSTILNSPLSNGFIPIENFISQIPHHRMLIHRLHLHYS